MLVLERRVGERLRIGDAVQVVVLSVRNGEVRLGIVAPRDVEVFREDIYRRIQAGHQHKPADESTEHIARSPRRRARYLRSPPHGT